MALEIKRAPVLRGKAARDFHKALTCAKESRSREDIREMNRKVREFLAKPENQLQNPLGCL
jgi:hypothetical protein